MRARHQKLRILLKAAAGCTPGLGAVHAGVARRRLTQSVRCVVPGAAPQWGDYTTASRPMRA